MRALYNGFKYQTKSGLPAPLVATEVPPEIHVKSRKPRHIAKVGVSIWLVVCYGEADEAHLRIEK